MNRISKERCTRCGAFLLLDEYLVRRQSEYEFFCENCEGTHYINNEEEEDNLYPQDIKYYNEE